MRVEEKYTFEKGRRYIEAVVMNCTITQKYKWEGT